MLCYVGGSDYTNGLSAFLHNPSGEEERFIITRTFTCGEQPTAKGFLSNNILVSEGHMDSVGINAAAVVSKHM